MLQRAKPFLVCCVFVSAFVVLVHLGPRNNSEQVVRPAENETRRLEAFFTVDGAEWIDSWNMVSPNVHIFSAYFDSRLGANSTVVRVIGLIRMKPSLKITCGCLIDQRRTGMQVAQAKVEFLQEHHDALYNTVFILCPYRQLDSSEPPRRVSIVIKGMETGTSRTIPVHSRNSHEHWDSLAVCVRPFYNGVPKVQDLRLFIAYYTVHGVTRFTFYEYESSQGVRSYLLSLRDKLKVDFLPWALPFPNKTWSMAQSAFTQDCLYRHAHASRRVLLVDLDEFMLPFALTKRRCTLSTLVSSLPQSKVCLMVRNVFLIRKPSTEDRPFIFKDLKRSTYVWRAEDRSKYVADPLRVLEGGIHQCYRFLKDVPRRDQAMILTETLLFHYKPLLFLYEPLVFHYNEVYRRDGSMLRWQDAVMSSPFMEKK